jgi:hypothetical protein
VEWLAVPAVTLSNLFICFSYLFIYLIPKNIGAIDRPLAGTYSTHPDVLSQHSLLTCFATGETTDETTDRTTSHLTNPAKDAGQVIGYSHSAMPPKTGGQAAGYSHLTKSANYAN